MKSAIIEARGEADRLECAAYKNMEQASGDGHHAKEALYMKVTGGKPTYFPKNKHQMESAIMKARGEADQLECAAHKNMGQVSGDDHHAKEAFYSCGLRLEPSVGQEKVLQRVRELEKEDLFW